MIQNKCWISAIKRDRSIQQLWQAHFTPIGAGLSVVLWVA